MRIDNAHFKSILKKSVEKTTPSKCIIRALTDEERLRYANLPNIQPASKKAINDFFGHITAHRRRCI